MIWLDSFVGSPLLCYKKTYFLAWYSDSKQFQLDVCDIIDGWYFFIIVGTSPSQVPTFSKGMERYSHEGYLIKVVVMALAGEVTRELSPSLSWSDNNYDLKLGEKAMGQELHIRSAVNVVMF